MLVSLLNNPLHVEMNFVKHEVEILKTFIITSEGNPWLRHSSHPWHLARPPAAAALACFFKE
jgi:hypothetical protein